jgi:hypothetical protein
MKGSAVRIRASAFSSLQGILGRGNAGAPESAGVVSAIALSSAIGSTFNAMSVGRTSTHTASFAVSARYDRHWMADRRRFFAVSDNPLVWVFFVVGVAGFIGWLTIGGIIFLIPMAIGIFGGTAVKARQK